MTDFSERLRADQEQVEQALQALFRDAVPRADLYDAMNYSLLAGGKRLRPVLVLECCRLCGGQAEDALPLACAVEMIHTYSLIHDDLPCMDNDDLRRGKPTSHRVYGEATAMLAGDGLLTAAFETVACAAARLSATQVVEAVEVLARAAGPAGMVGGQALDLAGEGYALSREELEQIHDLKTGAMMTAAAELGCIAAGASQEERKAVRGFAQNLGLAFQIRDDMLDVEGDGAALGKPIGSDAANEKNTFVTIRGLDACREEVAWLTERAVSALAPFPERGFLEELARRLAGREK